MPLIVSTVIVHKTWEALAAAWENGIRQGKGEALQKRFLLINGYNRGSTAISVLRDRTLPVLIFKPIIGSLQGHHSRNRSADAV